MKFNTTYIPTISLKDTIKELAEIRKVLLGDLFDQYQLLNVSLPLFLDADDEKLVDFKAISRELTFDFAYEKKVGRFLFSPTNYMRSLINKLNLKNEEGIIGQGKFLFRDLQENPVVSVVKEEIVLQIKFDNLTKAQEAVKELLDKMYQNIYRLASKAAKRYKLKMLMEKNPYFISAQELENENPNQNFKEREITFSQERNVFWLVAPGKKLYSGHTHTNLPLPLYDLNNFYQLIFRDRINSTVIKPLQISILANGFQLSDQLELYDETKYKSYSFYKKLMKEKFKIVEIKINVPRIAMSILAKGHIAELQPGIISEEAQTIATNFNVENY